MTCLSREVGADRGSLSRQILGCSQTKQVTMRLPIGSYSCSATYHNCHHDPTLVWKRVLKDSLFWVSVCLGTLVQNTWCQLDCIKIKTVTYAMASLRRLAHPGQSTVEAERRQVLCELCLLVKAGLPPRLSLVYYTGNNLLTLCVIQFNIR